MRQKIVAISILLLALGAVVSGTGEAMYRNNTCDWAQLPAEDSSPHNVTLTVEDHEVLLLGQDVWGHAETYSPHLLSNQTACELMGQYNQSLLFLQHTEVQEEQEVNGTTTYPLTRFDAFVAMNESCFMQAMFSSHYAPNSTDNWPHPDIVDSMHVFSGMQYVNTLRTALSSVIQENLTRDLNIISWKEPFEGDWPPVFCYLWSSNYTGYSFRFSDSGFGWVAWRHSNAERLLASLHWEIITVTLPYRLTTVLSVSSDGTLIQIQKEAIFSNGSHPRDDSSILILGAVITVGMIALVILYKRRRL
ncbi:hypothetical protein EU538_08530 [Candidatus Thorarchaeota archaeon]|nr:MAG: hypothetical protein EU538_08530 [Candidatus Thorarchaeota archaeon]